VIHGATIHEKLPQLDEICNSLCDPLTHSLAEHLAQLVAA